MNKWIKGLTAIALSVLFAPPLTATSAAAQKIYDPGASDAEIKIGNIMPYSGPASAYSITGKVQKAYFDKVNDEGGVNGRKVTFISYDDGYNPAKAVEQARKLVESDQVLLIFSSLGTPSNTAIQKYMNRKGVPQLFVSTGASKFGDPKNYPWTMGFQPTYRVEARMFAEHILAHSPAGKIAALYQGDDYGREFLDSLKEFLGEKASMIVAEAPYEATQPTIDSQIVTLKASGADIFVNIATPKFAAQAIRKIAELGWSPTHYVNNISSATSYVLKPAGLENAKGLISTAYVKDPATGEWADDPGFKEWSAFMDKYAPDADKANLSTVVAYISSQALTDALRRAGDNLTRANVMKQAASLNDVALGMLLPGISLNTGPDDYYPIERMVLKRFNGELWVNAGDAGR